MPQEEDPLIGGFTHTEVERLALAVARLAIEPGHAPADGALSDEPFAT